MGCKESKSIFSASRFNEEALSEVELEPLLVTVAALLPITLLFALLASISLLFRHKVMLAGLSLVAGSLFSLTGCFCVTVTLFCCSPPLDTLLLLFEVSVAVAAVDGDVKGCFGGGQLFFVSLAAALEPIRTALS